MVALTGEERVAERLVYSRFFDTTAADRSSNGVDGLLNALDDKRLEVSLHKAAKAQAAAKFKGSGSGGSGGGSGNIRIKEQERAEHATKESSSYMRHRVRRQWRQWQDIGASDQVLRWIQDGVQILFKHNRPPPNFHNGISSMRDATLAQLAFLEGELARFVESRAWEFSTCRKWVSRLFLLPKPGVNQWRCIIDLRVLNSYYVRKRLKMETLLGVRHLTKKGDYMFSFNLQDGFYAPGIAEADRDYFTVDVRDKLNRLSRQATRLIGRATRNARWLPVRELPSLAGQAQYLFLAIPAARFFLRELHSVVGDRLEARGFWSSEDERQHITWKELKAVRLAMESFLPHLAGRNVLLHEDNQASWFGPHSIDRFASALNTLLPRYNAAWLDPTCEAVDLLHLPDADWRRENNWCNAPWPLLPDLVQKLQQSGAAATVIASRWEGKAWHHACTHRAGSGGAHGGAARRFVPAGTARRASTSCIGEVPRRGRELYDTMG
eukprot:jgi/Tetstr1/458465/TSEL_004320.t1